MADLADIAGENDFNEEVLKRRSEYAPSVKRGSCLLCEEHLESNKLYCDDYCRSQYEREQNIRAKTRK